MSDARVRKGAAWTAEDDAEIARRCKDGEFLEDIAPALGRSIEGVRTRANILGIACRSGRTTRTRTRTQPKLVKGKYRLVCRRSDGSSASVQTLEAPDDAAAIQAAKCCRSEDGCEVWRIGDEPELLGRF